MIKRVNAWQGKEIPSDSRGFQDQNAGPDPSWLVAAGGSKKKNWTSSIFLLSEARLSTNDNGISIIYYIGL
jgi:hypothetical protein